MPSSIPIPVAATMKGSEVACNRAAAREPLSPTIGLYRAADSPRASSRARRNTGTSASAAGEERSDVELHPAGDEEEGNKDAEADGLELRVEAGMRHHLVAI